MRDIERAPTEASTVFERCVADLERLTRSLRGSQEATRVRLAMLRLGSLIGQRSLDASPRWSIVTDDCSPYELSLASRKGSSDLRLLIEAQADPPSPGAYWQAGRELNRRLMSVFNAVLTPFETVAAGFEPADANAFFAIAHAIEWRGDGETVTKVYLNPSAGGRDRAKQTLQWAADQFGVGRAWGRTAAGLSPTSDPIMLSLDLSASPRFKVYVKRWGAEPKDVNAEYHGIVGGTGDDVLRFVEAVTGQRGPLSKRPILTVYHFDRQHDTPTKMVVDIPFFPYVHSDAEAADRVGQALERFSIPDRDYRLALQAIGPADLARSVAFHSWVTIQPEAEGHRITTYFNPRLYLFRYGVPAYEPCPGFWSSPVPGRSESRVHSLPRGGSQ